MPCVSSLYFEAFKFVDLLTSGSGSGSPLIQLCVLSSMCTQLVWKVTKFFRNVLQIQSIPHDQEYLMNKNFLKSKYFIEPFFIISTIFFLSIFCSKQTFYDPSVSFLWVKVRYFLYKIQALLIFTCHCTYVYNIYKKDWEF